MTSSELIEPMTRPGAPCRPFDDMAFVELSPLLFSIAYRVIGTVADAEDMVSESYLRLRGVVDGGGQIRNLKQYLASTVTRLSIDFLRSARVRREMSAGDRLPEAVADPRTEAAFDRVESADSVATALSVLLETLAPAERAVFVLRHVFEFDYESIARLLGKSEVNCRQLLHRARRQLAAPTRILDIRGDQHAEFASVFVAAMQHGDLAGLVSLLTPRPGPVADRPAHGSRGRRRGVAPRSGDHQGRTIRIAASPGESRPADQERSCACRPARSPSTQASASRPSRAAKKAAPE